MRRPSHWRCSGHVQVAVQADSGAVEWRCSDCSDAGVVDGWRGGPHDLARMAGERAGAPVDLIEVEFPAEIYAALLDDRISAMGWDQLLYSARTSGGRVVLRGAADEVEEFYESVCAEANHAARGAFGRRLNRACDILHEVFFPDPVLVDRGARAADDPDGEAQAAVEHATRGLALGPAELEGLRWLYQELELLIPGSVLGRPAIDDALRSTGEVVILDREIREVLAVTSVDYRHVQIFLRAVETTLGQLEAFAERCPDRAIDLYRRFFSGIAAVADRIAVDENDLADVIQAAAQAALVAGRKVRGVSGLRPVASDLIDLWLADTCCAFHFVPDLLVGLGLGKRERNWLRKQLDERAQGATPERRDDLTAMMERLA